MSLKSKTVSGVKWTTISRIIIAVTALLKVSVLARLLDAEDFGLMALVTFVLGFMNLFMDMGLTSAILHKQGITKREYASLYWINVIFSFILFGLISGASPMLASFYEEPELAVLIPIMATGIIFSALGRQFKTIEQKELNFKYIAITDIAGAVAGLIVGVMFAVWGYGVFALVYAALTKYAVSNLIYFWRGLKTKGMLFHFNFAETKPFLSIGLYQVGGQVTNYFSRDLDILLIGKFLGTDVLGGYSLAKQLVKRPMQVLNPIITKVASPVLAIIQKDKKQLSNKFLSFLNLVSTANFTVYLLIALGAYPLVLLLYGIDFLHIVIIVQILSGYMFLRSVGNPIGSLVIATGRTDLEFYWNLIVMAIMPFVILFGVQFNVVILAVCLLLTMVILTPLAWKFLIFRLLEVSFFEYMKALIPRWRRLYKEVLNGLT